MERLWLFGLFFLGLAACGTAVTQQSESEISNPVKSSAFLPDPSTPAKPGSGRGLGPAPELTSEVWLNVGAPLRLADLRGKVVAIDMWTFG